MQIIHILLESHISFSQWKKLAHLVGDRDMERRLTRNRSVIGLDTVYRRAILLEHVVLLVDNHYKEVLMLHDTAIGEQRVMKQFSALTSPWKNINVEIDSRRITSKFAMGYIKNKSLLCASIESSLVKIGLLLTKVSRC